jgi:hypothetical protein
MGIRLSRDKHKFMRKPKPEPPPAKIEFVIPAPPPPPPAPIQLPEPGVPFLRRGQHQCAWIEGNSRAEIVMCCGKPIPLNSRFAFCKKHMEKGLVGRKS